MKRTTLAIATLTIVTLLASSTWAQRPGRLGRPGGPPNPLLHLFDADKDGVLSKAEIEAASAKLADLDKDKDGKLTNKEMRGAMPFGPGGPRGRRTSFVSPGDFKKEPLPRDEAEKRVLTAMKQMWQGERFANVSPTDGRLLRLLAEAADAKRVVEIGTSTGESATWLALAMRSTGGHVFTHEIDEHRAEVAKANFKKAGVDKLVTVLLGDAHELVKRYADPSDPLYVKAADGDFIDILFLDADKQGYIDYLNKLMPLIRPGGLIIAHNMNTRQADPKFVKAITTNPDLETLILLKDGTGVGVTLKKRH